MRRLVVAALLVAGMAPAREAAAQLQASPTLIEVGASASATRLTLGNTGTEPLAVQVRVFAWTQADGQDQLAASDDLGVSPPISEIPAGGQQLVRIVRLAPPAEGRDRAYRIVVDELPGDAAESGSTVRVRLQYVLPVFVRAAGATGPQLTCRLENASRLTCTNAGGRAAQLGASRLIGAEGQGLTLTEGLYGYVLAGSHRTWALPAGAAVPAGSTLQLETRLNGETTTLPVARTP